MYQYTDFDRHFVRARVTREDGILHATPLQRQGSGMLRSMVGINALLDIPPGEVTLEIVKGRNTGTGTITGRFQGRCVRFEI